VWGNSKTFGHFGTKYYHCAHLSATPLRTCFDESSSTLFVSTAVKDFTISWLFRFRRRRRPSRIYIYTVFPSRHRLPSQNSYTSICIRKHLESLLALRNVYTWDSTYSCILMNMRAEAVAGKFDKVPAAAPISRTKSFTRFTHDNNNNICIFTVQGTNRYARRNA